MCYINPSGSSGSLIFIRFTQNKKGHEPMLFIST